MTRPSSLIEPGHPKPMTSPEPLRGEVWDVRFPAFGEHPGVVLSVHRRGVLALTEPARLEDQIRTYLGL